MYLLVGLGNPGSEYASNRHNVGFHFVDFVLSQPGIAEKAKKLGNSCNGEAFRVGNTVFLKPDTFMNRSGHAVAKAMRYFKIRPDRVFVALDDLDIPLGMSKVTFKGPKIHNGLSSIRDTIGDAFMKIRIGIENRPSEFRIPGESYVLQNFTAEERKALEPVFAKLWAQLSRAIL
ncbi:MAG: aminoacyl-tRNA hydrolase [Patescibacteria group bacterium]|nr:aminoacyl-tRNA hydrolase [Patescibacteria group bacterium]